MMYEKPTLETIDLGDNISTMDIVGASQDPDSTSTGQYGNGGVW